MSLLALALVFTGCSLEDDRDLCCPEQLTMHYVYRPRGSNIFRDNIFSLRHFLFDAEERFIAELPSGTLIDRQPLGLSSGCYTMVTLGNMSDATVAEHCEDLTIDGFMLRHTTPNRKNRSSFANTDELFWGVKRFEVDSEGRGVEVNDTRSGLATNRLVTEMSNIHCHLNVTVEWTNRPPYVGTYEMELSGIHTQYSLNPGNIHLTADGFAVPEGDIPQPYRLDVPLRQLALRAEFVTLRYTDTTIPTLCIRYDGEPVIPDIDLTKAFRAWGWRPSATHVQEYNILLRVINENRVEVVPLIEGSVADWVNGGSFG